MQAWRQYLAFTPKGDISTLSEPKNGEPYSRSRNGAEESSPIDGEIRASEEPSSASTGAVPATAEGMTSDGPRLEKSIKKAEPQDPAPAVPEDTVSNERSASEPTTSEVTRQRQATTESVASTLHNAAIPNDKETSTSQYRYVDFEPNDPMNPHNWSWKYRIFVLSQLTFLTLSLTFASSASSPAEQGMIEEFGCNDVVATATTGMFLVGMGIGAIPFAPLSELYGRLPIYVGTIFFASIFEIACAVAPSAGSLVALRFIAGLVSSAPLSNAGGTLFDIGDPLSRTLMFPVFAVCGFIAPIVAPIMGGFVVTNPAYGWRWMYWICAIWNGIAFLLVTFCMPETLGQALLKTKAQRLRKVTGDKRWRAKVEDEKLMDATTRALKRPFKMLMVEPVVQFFIVYLTGWLLIPCPVTYIVLYGSFTAYPLIFANHGLSTRQQGLTFIPVGIGFIFLMGISYLHYLRYRNLRHDAKEGVERLGIFDGKVEPEERLVPLMVLAILFPAGLFWLSWTSPSHFNVWIPIMSGFPFGLGLLAIFLGSMQYMMDAYGQYASSALACSTLVRYCVPGVVILAYPQMYKTLGNVWATSLFAFIALALTPVPFVFHHYGRRVRSKCQFTVKY